MKAKIVDLNEKRVHLHRSLGIPEKRANQISASVLYFAEQDVNMQKWVHLIQENINPTCPEEILYMGIVIGNAMSELAALEVVIDMGFQNVKGKRVD